MGRTGRTGFQPNTVQLNHGILGDAVVLNGRDFGPAADVVTPCNLLSRGPRDEAARDVAPAEQNAKLLIEKLLAVSSLLNANG